MTEIPRPTVLWLGSADTSDFEARLNVIAGLQLRPILNEAELSENLAAARAVVFEFDGNTGLYVGRVRRTSEAAAANGVLMVLLNGSATSPEDFQVVVDRIFALVAPPYGPECATFRPVREFQRDLCQAAHEISIWRAGPASSPGLKISGNFKSVHDTLLRRSFADFKTIEVTPIGGGASHASVYSVTPLEQPRMRFLAKVDATDRIAIEVDRYMKYVANTVFFNNRPNIDPVRTIYTPANSILVEDFLERAAPIYEVLPHSTPAVLVASVFEGALRNWRRDAELVKQKLATVRHFEKILKRRTETFFKAAHRAKEAFKSPLGGEELLSACGDLPPVDCTYSRIHGDLHAGNIYVGTGSTDSIIIDFYNTEMGPMAMDAACLDVDIVFKRSKRISHALALRLYEYPLRLPPVRTPVRSEHIWLVDTIRAVRSFGLAEPDREAYTFAVACYLIRFASFDDNGTAPQRAIAACMAAHLINRLVSDKKN